MEEMLHHQKDGWNPIDNGINHRFQLVIRISQPPTINQLWYGDL